MSVHLSEREKVATTEGSDKPELQLTRIDIVPSSPKLDRSAAYAEATAAGNKILDLGWAANNEIEVFFELKSHTYDTKITRK